MAETLKLKDTGSPPQIAPTPSSPQSTATQMFLRISQRDWFAGLAMHSGASVHR